MPDWEGSAHRLWGEEFIAPMSEVLGINRRTIERWRAGRGEPAQVIQSELARLARRPEAGLIGGILRRMAAGETIEAIRADIRAQQVALARIEAEIGRYSSIGILALRARSCS